ncbi:hypothetical protein PGTUg99_009493 [Puccinia graminis f. sp. tritici]|uniref:Uncharacterized protein n=1 Tax=Puccinia graminis f. sp. tritici TaxID=56615 RepID=A0A5B0LUH9_PUCGR|nr:hypothetical protein PGTUg99_009493 [Puccinia graminis f. sp. tritici]
MQNPLSYQWMTNNNKSIRLLSSFLGFFDIKLGVTIICLISLLNKVVGFYGILAVFHGANLIQISMYLYNILTIGLVIYGLQATGEVNHASHQYYHPTEAERNCIPPLTSNWIIIFNHI